MKILKRTSYLLVLFIIQGCTHTEQVVLDELELPHEFISTGDVKLSHRWWNSFDNQELNHFIKKALEGNNGLNASQLRAKVSELGIVTNRKAQLPEVNLTGGTNADIDQISKINTAHLGLAASWEIDLWGKIDARENRSVWQYRESKSLFHAKANLVAGNTANAWLSILSEFEKQQILIKQYQRTSSALKVISRRFAMGKSSVTNIWQQEKLLKSIEVKQRKNDAAYSLAKQSLALWLGHSDEHFNNLSSTSMPKLPALPELGLPIKYLENRPDIQQALAKVKAADESLAMAIAERLPRLTLRANYSTNKNGVSDLFDDWAGNLISALVLPVFDANQKNTVVKQERLRLSALVLEYKQTWIEAIAAVNKALVNEQQLAAVVDNLQLQLSLAKKTERLLTVKYLNSKATFLNLLKAQEDILALELQQIEAQQALLTNRILLYRELSDGEFTTA